MALWGKTDQESDKPKWLSDVLRNDQTVSDKDSTYGVSVAEARVSANRAKGLKTQGWTQTMSYTDAQGNVRNKSEILVAIGSDMTGDDADDAVVVDRVIAITVQPQNVAVTGATSGVSFSVTAAATPTAALTYQWSVSTNGGSTWTPIVGATTATLSIAAGDVSYALHNNRYRVAVSSSGATTINSSSATLTVSPVTTISAQPQDLTVAAGNEASFSVTAATEPNGTEAYQWSVSTNGGSTWTPVSGATSATLTIAAGDVVVGLDGNQYRVAVSSTGATTVTSTAATLTVTA